MTTHTPDKPERPRTLGRTVHEKYPAAVVGETPELTLCRRRRAPKRARPHRVGAHDELPCLPR